MDNAWFTRDTKGDLVLVPEDMLGNPSIREITDLAVARGALTTFDFATPQGWVDDVIAKTGEYPYGFVWSYPERSIWGEPFPLTVNAKALLDRYEEARRG